MWVIYLSLFRLQYTSPTSATSPYFLLYLQFCVPCIFKSHPTGLRLALTPSELPAAAIRWRVCHVPAHAVDWSLEEQPEMPAGNATSSRILGCSGATSQRTLQTSHRFLGPRQAHRHAPAASEALARLLGPRSGSQFGAPADRAGGGGAGVHERVRGTEGGADAGLPAGRPAACRPRLAHRGRVSANCSMRPGLQIHLAILLRLSLLVIQNEIV